MQSLRYTDRAPVYSDKGAVVATGLVQHTAAPSTYPGTKQVLLDTRDDKLRINYQHSVDKETINTQHTASYEKKGDERLDRAEPVNKPALVHQMSKPLPAVPTTAAPVPVNTINRETSESEPQYVTVYEDGAQLFSPRTVNLLGTAARLPPPPTPSLEPTTPTATMHFPVMSATTDATTSETVQTTESVVAAPPATIASSSIIAQPAAHQQVPAVQQTTQPPAVVAVPSWPPAEAEHDVAVAKRVVEASTVREESPLMAGVEKETPSPLIVSTGPQPYELAHPKNTIDVVQLPPAPPTLPATAVETVQNNAAPLPLLPPAQTVLPAPKAAVAPLPLSAPGVSPAAAPALPAPTRVMVQSLRPVVSTTTYEQAQPRIRSAVVPAVAAAPRRQWTMPRLFDVLLSPYAIGVYVLLAGMTLLHLPFWLLVTLAVLVDAAVIAYWRRPAKPTTLAVISGPTHAPRRVNAPLPLPAPVVPTAVIPALPAPVHSVPQHLRTVAREYGTQTEVAEQNEASDTMVVERTAQHTVQIKKLAPSARQQAAVPLLADAQPVAPTGVIVDTSSSNTGSQLTAPQRYVQTVPTTPVGAALPSPSKLPNPLLDALNSASPRRELKELTEAVETYHDMQPATALPSQVEAAARRAAVTIPAAGSGEVQGASNPVVMVPTWPSTEQQHSVAQARQVVEASTVREHSALLDDSDSGATAAYQSQPYEMAAVPHSRTAVTQTSDVLALPAPTAPVSTTAPLALPVPVAPSFRVSASEVAPVTSTERVVQTGTALPATSQPLAGEEYAVKGVKRVVSEERKEAAVVADVGEVDRVSDVGAGIVNESSVLRLRHIASRVHSQ